MRRKLLSIIFFACIIFSVFAQEEDSDWYWDKPITTIDFEGLNSIKKSELTGIIGSFIDRPFTMETYNDILDRLYSLDFFDDIETFAKHDKHPDTVLLVLKVTEKPIVSKVIFTGNFQIRNNELKETVKTKINDLYSENRLLLDERLIRDHYIEKGYSDAAVSHITQETEDGILVTFQIDEGENTVISEIHMTGNTIVSERVLKNKISLKEVGFLKDGAFQNSALELDKKQIISYYTERGYIDAAIIDVTIDSSLNEDKNRHELVINFIISEGSQYKFAGLTVSGNEIFESDVLLACMKLKSGSIFNSVKFQEGISAIQNVYYENGYMSNEFQTFVKRDADRKEISYELIITERARSHIENIIVQGNNKTKDYVITREIPIESGDVFSNEKIMSGLRNLYNLQYFSNVIPDVMQGSEQNLVDIVFNVEEQSTINLNFGMAFSEVKKPNEIPVSLYFTLENSNLFGEGRTISTTMNIAKSQQTIDFSYGQNWIGDQPITYNQSVSFSHTNSSTPFNMFLPDLTFDQYYYFFKYEGYSASISTALGRRWTPNFAILSLSGGLTNTITRYNYDEQIYVPVDNTIAHYTNRIGLINSLWASFSIDDRDISYNPSEGWFASERVSFTGLIPKLEKEFFMKSDTKLEGYLTLWDKNWGKFNFKGVLSAYTGLTTIFPFNNSSLSESNKAYIDGMFTGRGWTELYNLSTERGKVLWTTQLELRIPFVENVVGFDFFHDTVVVKPEINQLFNSTSISDFYCSFGPGIKFLMPQFPLHMMFTYRYQIVDGKPVLGGANGYAPYQFVLSFNITNN